MISVICPVYNKEKYLDECITSIINQTYKELEIILVNDGSTDASLKMLKNYQKQDDRIIIIDKPNGGVSTAWNAGLDRATGEWLGFVSTDDIIDLDMFEKLLNACLKENTQISSCGLSRKMTGSTETDERLTKLKSPLPREEALATVFDASTTGSPVNKIFHKSVVGNIRYHHDITIGEDGPWVVEVVKNCEAMSIVPLKLYRYREVQGSIMRSFHAKHLSAITANERMLEMVTPISKKLTRIARSRLAGSGCMLIMRAIEADEKSYIPKIRQRYIKHLPTVLYTSHMSLTLRVFCIMTTFFPQLSYNIFRRLKP